MRTNKVFATLTILFLGSALVVAAVLQNDAKNEGVHSNGQIKYLIGVSHPNLNGSWQIQMNKEIKKEIAQHGDARVIFTDAAQNADQQVEDIETMIKYGIDLLIVSVDDSSALTPVITEVYTKIPVIVLGRGVKGYDYTLYIGSDNHFNGKMAAKEAIKLLGNKQGEIVEVRGMKGSLQAEERSKGFNEMIGKETNYTITETIYADWLKDKAEDQMKGLLISGIKPDLIYAHNDAMAYGAYKALKEEKLNGVRIIGSDGINEENGGLQLVKEGIIDTTFVTPTGGSKAAQYAIDILHNVPGLPKKIIVRDHEVTADNVDHYLNEGNDQTDQLVLEKKRNIKLGFAQLGTESEWRLANTQSVISAAKEAGIELKVKNAENDQSKQIDIIREFIKQEVDIIVFSPKVEQGWDAVLTEAKKAGIPVILMDREINVDDQSLWTSFIGSDFEEEGKRAAKWLVSDSKSAKSPVHIIELEGTKGSAPAKDRKKGFQETIKGNLKFQLLKAYSGDFTMLKGRKMMEKALKAYGKKIDVVYAHNDDMALGAIQAIEEYRLKPGEDIKIISIDATDKAFRALSVGKMNFTVECNPLLGPQLMKAIKDLASGIEIPKKIITSEETFTQNQAKKELYRRDY
ncbi:substrate-binding domain-containing protein [Bacillus sp. CECT 9360]|uniref:substrate-binding domain-containing protein n=1 Tax=Bacillus sp. CECT 9360 TaxID=2845821 RepID=UPI001E4CBAC0|nr:substrate-binding domain-containing protein [Bacillus sp. CECT 9360]CAH0343899.1 HTH-type transcriptional repressor PurR [Bacillus sp. CECT 9360]